MTVKVVAVVEDSRCPKDVDCIQAGNAKVRVSIKNGSDPLKVVDLDLNAGQKSAMYGKYKIVLTALTPYPATAAPIKRNKYMATLTVEPAAS